MSAERVLEAARKLAADGQAVTYVAAAEAAGVPTSEAYTAYCEARLRGHWPEPPKAAARRKPNIHFDWKRKPMPAPVTWVDGDEAAQVLRPVPEPAPAAASPMSTPRPGPVSPPILPPPEPEPEPTPEPEPEPPAIAGRVEPRRTRRRRVMDLTELLDLAERIRAMDPIDRAALTFFLTHGEG
jgi:hypothetical protein